ncbi:MAG: lysophospholipase [Anaerolineae bacterium]|nr:lysophospholipase [Anaerolineae bacterium]
MKHTTNSFKTTDGISIHTESWLPEAEAKAVVIVVHGLGEHVARYAHVAARLNAAGYAVYGLDHRSHGRSGGDVRAYFEDFNQPVSDLAQYFIQIKNANPDKKIFVYAHSLGTLIGMTFAVRHQRDLAGMIISGTPLEVESLQPALLIRAGDLLNSILPKMPITPLPSSGLSHDPAVVQGYDNDPLVYHGNVRVRMAHHIIHVSRAIKMRLRDLPLPMLIIHGVDDPICPSVGSVTLHQGISTSDKTLKLYPGLFHEIHNEPEKETVFDDMVAWLDQHR